MFAMQYSGIDLYTLCRKEAEEMAGSDSGFPTRAERKARRAERLADLRFRMKKGYPVSWTDMLWLKLSKG